MTPDVVGSTEIVDLSQLGQILSPDILPFAIHSRRIFRSNVSALPDFFSVVSPPATFWRELLTPSRAKYVEKVLAPCALLRDSDAERRPIVVHEHERLTRTRR